MGTGSEVRAGDRLGEGSWEGEESGVWWLMHGVRRADDNVYSPSNTQHARRGAVEYYRPERHLGERAGWVRRAG